ncbi:hypothetical protein SAMN04489710_101519 [Paracidovorax konjaci]|uniref:Uncharacterized protein n=1 Tax=Paracidovorax konjaci TaxID=32040 RepID=A0A1I1RZZ5_9BURK|nr:hypothetical protein SAMN04489710_101519 [Paracidovorax konjaci]
MALKIPLLRGTKRLVKENLCRTMQLSKGENFIGFSAAYKKCRVGRLSFTSQPSNRGQASGFRKQSKLIQSRIKIWKAKIHPHQNDGSGTFVEIFERTQGRVRHSVGATRMNLHKS